MVVPAQIIMGFRGDVTTEYFYFRANYDSISGVFDTWRAVVRAGGAETIVDTGIVPSSDPCAPDNWQILESADRTNYLFYLGGTLVATIAIPAAHFTGTFRHIMEALLGASGADLVSVTINTDYSCGSMGRDCQGAFPD